MTSNSGEPFDYDKAVAELPILRDFIDFLNKQVGVYTDSLSGFQGTKIKVERQVARIMRPVRKFKDGEWVMSHTSLEDPSSPDVIHVRIIRADDLIEVNSPQGFNETQICWSIIVFIFTYWEETVRSQIARVRGIHHDKVRVNVFGDLRLIRNAIIHHKGVLSRADFEKLVVMKGLFRPETRIQPSHDEMHKIFTAMKQGIAEIILHYVGHLPGAPKDIGKISGLGIMLGGGT